MYKGVGGGSGGGGRVSFMYRLVFVSSSVSRLFALASSPVSNLRDSCVVARILFFLLRVSLLVSRSRSPVLQVYLSPFLPFHSRPGFVACFAYDAFLPL